MARDYLLSGLRNKLKEERSAHAETLRELVDLRNWLFALQSGLAAPKVRLRRHVRLRTILAEIRELFGPDPPEVIAAAADELERQAERSERRDPGRLAQRPFGC